MSTGVREGISQNVADVSGMLIEEATYIGSHVIRTSGPQSFISNVDTKVMAQPLVTVVKTIESYDHPSGLIKLSGSNKDFGHYDE